ncbi:heme-binding protein [Inquilinus ginsengisoli]|uniref:heme-binding protein n=1 Tax=Inquilinus ginsengisoli TaxID=363840 RepID=UPI00286B423A|nr:heme-binding protein [Inquilinus ginsengisoli]
MASLRATSRVVTDTEHRRIFRLPAAVAAIALMLGATVASGPAAAQVSKSGFILPMDLALEASQEAVRTCAATGYDVTATVVDVSGTPQVVLRGDNAMIHTNDCAYRKAYTIVTMGPIFQVTTTSQSPVVLTK